MCTSLMSSCVIELEIFVFLFLTGLSKRGNVDEVVPQRYARENVLFGM